MFGGTVFTSLSVHRPFLIGRCVYISDCDWPCRCEGKPVKPQFVRVNL